FGAPVAGRQWVDTEGLIGCFLNTLALRTDLSSGPTFRELAAQVRSVTLGAYSNQNVPFEAILARLQVQRDLARNPLFQVLFNMTNQPAPDLVLPGLALRVLTPAEIPSKLDMTFYLGVAESSLAINLVYNADLFDEARMADLLAQLQLLLEQAVEQPDVPIDHHPLLTEAARALLADPGAAIPVPGFPSVAEMFLACVAAGPERMALEDSASASTYADLADRARSIADSIRAAGAEPGNVVAVSGPRSPELIAGFLGVFLSGGVLLLLDRNLPSARLRVMIEDARPGCLVWIGDEEPGDWIGDLGMPLVRPGEGPKARASSARGNAPGWVGGPVNPDDPAYIFFTSGTTGRPKAVLGRQKGLSHFLTWQRETFGIGAGDRAAQLTGLSFDVVLRDILLPLTSGATLVLPEEDDLSPERILPWLAERAITVAHTVPSL